MDIHLRNKIDELVSRKVDFSAKVYTGRMNVFFPRINKKTRWYSPDASIKAGSHLNKMVIEKCNKRIADGSYVMPKYEENHPCRYIFYNKDLAELMIDVPGYAVDINSCYWTTAYKLGIIDQDLYELGLSKEEWKTIRNSAIGSLGAFVTYIEAKEGKIISDKTSRRPTHPARTHVIESVWNLALDMYKKFPKGIFMFLTDCFFIRSDYYNEVTKELERIGYKYKAEEIFVNNFSSHTIPANARNVYIDYIEWVLAENNSEEFDIKMMKFTNVNEIHTILNAPKKRK